MRIPRTVSWMIALALVCALGLSSAAPPDAGAAVVLCKRKKKILLRENACRRNEQALALSGGALDAAGAPKVGTATRADSAAQADSATRADTAADAEALGGLAPQSYQHRVRWALVAGDGTIVAQSGGISVKSTATNGVKIMDFGEPLLGRGVIATLNAGSTATGFVMATICGGDTLETKACNVIVGADDTTSELAVVTLNTAGPPALENKSFYVAVLP